MLLRTGILKRKVKVRNLPMKRKVFGKKNENLTKENAELQDVVSAFKTQVLNPRLNTYTYR